MKVVHKAISFDLEEVTAQEVPYLNAFYRDGVELNKDINDLLGFPMANKDNMPFYTIKDSTTYELNKQFEAYYAMMMDALRIAFKDRAMLDKFFDCEFWREHGDRFLPYAKATLMLNQPALYGRFDACFYPDTEKLKGVYEFNGDTPVMLFESVNLQARYSKELGTDQFNNYLDIFKEQIGGRGYNEVAIVVGTDYVEDMATADTLCQMFREALPMATVQFADIKELDFDHANLEKPFILKGDTEHLDAIFVLSPWEEMVNNFPQMLNDWERWIGRTHLFEPAWRWFLAHKGMTALCTYLCDRDPFWMAKHYEAYQILIPAYVVGDFVKQFWNDTGKWVEKPVVGRLSNNIKVWENGKLVIDTGGFYTGENTVFQEYTAPGKVDGKNFILGFWMCGQHSATLCMREFDQAVLSISNERYIPHIVEDDE